MLWNKILLITMIQIAAEFVLARLLIPYFRRLKTGKFDFYIGDRFKSDGSSPKFGGVIMAAALITGVFPALTAVISVLGIDNSAGRRIISSVVFSLLLMTIGIYEDYVKERTGRKLGIKMRYKAAAEMLLCLCWLAVMNIQGDKTTAVLLPFRLGYIEFGVLYIPVMTVLMTCAVNAVKIHDCFSGDTDGSCPGLCCMTSAVFALCIAVCCQITDNPYGEIYAYCIAGAAVGFLIWGLSPAKIFIGESGSLLLGGLIASLTLISGLHLIFVLAGLAFVVDGVCSLIQYLVYRKNKKLILKGSSLHSHLAVKGWSDYKIIGMFLLITAAGGAAAIAFAIYSTKL